MSPFVPTGRDEGSQGGEGYWLNTQPHTQIRYETYL